MEDLYNKASLVLTPQMVETGKVYSMKPEDRKGDFTFSRSTAATKVNASGNIEKETQNLSLYSNTFSSWTAQSSGSVTSGQSGYDGTNDAWLLTSGSFTYSRIERTINYTGLYTISLYAKAGTLSWLSFENSGITSDETYFDLVNGTTGTNGSNVVRSSIESVGNGWYRCTATLSGTSNVQRIYPAVGNGDLNSAQGNIYIQDFQFEQGLVARDVITTTTTAIYGGITDNVPRLDYTDSSCPALLLEPQRTNKIGNSEFINNDSSWYEANGADCTPNYALSPEGVNNATRVQLDNSGAFSLTRIYHDFVPDASNDTASFYAKSNTGSSFDIVIYFRDSGFGAVRGSKTITITNEWQRFDLTADCSGAAGNVMFLIYNTTASENWDFLMYGAQVEQGSYATSYIPTYGSAVTRNADNSIVTSADDLIGQTEGTIFIECEYPRTGSGGTARKLISVNSGNSANLVDMFVNAGANTLTARVRANSAGFGSIGISNNPTGIVKIAYAYKANDYTLYINGTQYGSVTSGGAFTFSSPLDNIQIGDGEAGGDELGGKASQALVFKTRLSNEELATLTAI